MHAEGIAAGAVEKSKTVAPGEEAEAASKAGAGKSQMNPGTPGKNFGVHESLKNASPGICEDDVRSAVAIFSSSMRTRHSVRLACIFLPLCIS